MVQMNQFAGQKYRHRCREQTYGHQRGRGGVMKWEIRIDIYTLICIKWVTNKNLLCKKINKIQKKKKKEKCLAYFGGLKTSRENWNPLPLFSLN